MSRCIYKIINVVNNKFYVGSAVNFEKRKSRHLWMLRRGDHANKHLQSAWNKYGEPSFVFAIVQEVPETEDLLAAENVWLKEHVGKDYCYNLATDATAPQLGMFGNKNAMWGKTFSHTEDAKARIGLAAKSRVQSDEEKAKRRQSMKGHPVSTATRLKISASLSGEKNYWYGKSRSAGFCAAVSKPILVTDQDGSENYYSSISEARYWLDLKPPTINRALKSGKPLTRGPYKGWAFKYA